ncbi:integrase [Gossypium australe]|uniref:Integrase n=1 Tax=Gossypium australe TaxID=47621 RepID=A0A5B6VPL8_9ROSI|nr:integrase [Gossypium australe]
MNAQLKLEYDGFILAELKVKPLSLQKIQALQFDDLKLLAKRKMVENGQIADYSIGLDDSKSQTSGSIRVVAAYYDSQVEMGAYYYGLHIRVTVHEEKERLMCLFWVELIYERI